MPDAPQDNWVRVPLGKGCVLVLTWAEYRQGVARGKAERRRTALTTRLAKIPASGRLRGNVDG